jgi:hypothetical protein
VAGSKYTALAPLRHQWPTWLVSAKYRRVVRHDGDSDWLPVGVQHARQAGENRTACGLVAIGWPIFWLLPFTPANRASCPSCRKEVEQP